MEQIIIHVDMDAFFASVETRDNPALRGKPLIIGSLPGERGVVATCSYEARKYGVHSAMNIKEAYRRCPQGIYMHPNIDKYKAVSGQLHGIWNTYASAAEAIALDEAYLDVTQQAENLEGARRIAMTIKQRTRDEIGLTCSVGVAYSKTAAKTASEEKKPDGYFEIPTPKDFVDVGQRPVRLIGVNIYNLSSEEGRQLSLFDFMADVENDHKAEIRRLLDALQGRYHLDFAGHLDQIYQMDTLRKTVEYMRKHI